MADLIIRLTGQDTTLLSQLAPGGASARASGIGRVVVDAPAAAKTATIRVAAQQVGLPYLIDPLTFYLADHQHPDDPWGRLPFANPTVVTVADLNNTAAADRLVAATLEFQLDHGATQLMAPYVHVERADDGWTGVQALLYRRTRRYLSTNNVALPVLAPLALSWRLLGRVRWADALEPLAAALGDLAPTDVALAASRVHQGVHADHRLADLLAVTSELASRHSVIAWRQGVFGEASVAAGASGYETGIGWGERCDLRNRMADRRRPPSDGFSARPVYVTNLGASLPKRSVTELMSIPAMAARLTCLDHSCCPTGKQALLTDARAHAVRARAARLEAVASAGHPRWAWKLIADRAHESLDLAVAVNTLADRGVVQLRTDVIGHSALVTVADVRRQASGRGRAA
jgi:hypothetical protein